MLENKKKREKNLEISEKRELQGMGSRKFVAYLINLSESFLKNK